MNNQKYMIAGIVAVLAVVLATTLTITASKDTKKTISESIPHGSEERPLTK